MEEARWRGVAELGASIFQPDEAGDRIRGRLSVRRSAHSLALAPLLRGGRWPRTEANQLESLDYMPLILAFASRAHLAPLAATLEHAKSAAWWRCCSQRSCNQYEGSGAAAELEHLKFDA